MQSPRTTRSSLLGKRSQPEPSTPAHCDRQLQLQTPDQTPNPKRARTSSTVLDGDSNKENVAPFNLNAVALSPSPRAARALRRTSTASEISPPRVRPTPSRRASTSSLVPPATPATAFSHLTISTPPPTPPNSLLPIHIRARTLLRATCNNTTTEMAGRDAERKTIQSFLDSFIHGPEAAEYTSLYVSGSPGTGKTAMVNSILHSLDARSFEAQVIVINCMAINTIDALWEKICVELGAGDQKRKIAGRVKKTKGRDAVDVLLSSLRSKCILVLDELDHIAPTTQSIAALFSLPASHSATLRMIGIANTHTLTSSPSSAGLSHSTSVHTLHFAPYTSVQLLDILQSRLAPLYTADLQEGETVETTAKTVVKQFLPLPTLTLLSKKIAALTGDVRSLFEVLRGAIDLATTSSPSPTPKAARQDENPLNVPQNPVTPTHILAALKAYSPSSSVANGRGISSSAPSAANSEIVSKIVNLGLQARLVLLSLLLASKRLEAGLSLSTSPSNSGRSSPVKRNASQPTHTTPSSGMAAVEPTQLHVLYTAMLTRSGDGVFPPVSRSEFGDLIGVLEGMGLIVSSASSGPASSSALTTKGKRAFGRSASFGYGVNRGPAGGVRLAGMVRSEEVSRGLGIGEKAAGSGDAKTEEVAAIWERERGRLTREVNAKSQATNGKAAASFDGAMED